MAKCWVESRVDAAMSSCGGTRSPLLHTMGTAERNRGRQRRPPLKAVREKGLSQEELAHSANIHQTYLSGAAQPWGKKADLAPVRISFDQGTGAASSDSGNGAGSGRSGSDRRPGSPARYLDRAG
jgi:hypothetical protein